MSLVCGLLLLDKPRGMTSHDVVAAIRRAAGERRVGHAGTLDPLATGLLLLCLGKATRICEYLVGHDKRYRVTARLGVSTDTYDADGRATEAYDGPLPADDQIEVAARALRGEIEQTPPPYSAVKVEGRPAYWHARRGQPVAVNPRHVTIYSMQWRRLAADEIEIDVHSSSGTYVRSLVHDLGQALGCGAHVTSLRRLSVGRFSVEQALMLDEATARLAGGDVAMLLGLREALPDMPTVSLDEEAIVRLAHGQSVSGCLAAAGGAHLALDASGRPVAVVEPEAESGLWRPRKVMTSDVQPCNPA